MKFNKMIALMAILGLVAQSNAYAGGPLRRVQTAPVAQSENDPAAQPQVIVIPSNGAQTTTIQTQVAATPAPAPAPAAAAPVASAPVVQQQPVTVVEAAPASESKAEGLRKARQDAEVQTEQKIVEKLEESRLKEEQQRAERLFGDKFEAQAPAAAAATAAPVAQTQPAAAVAPAVVTPVAPVPAPEQKPTTQVTIEKLEIVQPPAVDNSAKVADTVENKAELAPAGESQLKVNDADKEKPAESKYYAGGLLAAPEYNASNVKTNYGLGVAVGTLIDEHNAIEVSFLYSSYLIDTFWTYGLYKELTQYDLQLAYKYYILSGPLKPYIGGSATYINRTYQDRVKNGIYYMYNQTSDSENTNAVDVGLLAGVDYQISPRILLGAGLDYNHNVMNSRADFTSVYKLQADDTKALEEIDYYTFKITAKMSF